VTDERPTVHDVLATRALERLEMERVIQVDDDDRVALAHTGRAAESVALKHDDIGLTSEFFEHALVGVTATERRFSEVTAVRSDE
jgi:hypothetical protein